MLSQEEKEKIKEESKHYPYKSAACIEALKIVQKEHRWVSDEHIKEIAELLDMTASDVDSVATFYNRIYRKPVGRHIILMCESITCWVMGYENLHKHITEKLGINYGETTKDDKFTLLPNPCLGNCDKSPCMIIDDQLYDMLTVERIDEILDKII